MSFPFDTRAECKTIREKQQTEDRIKSNDNSGIDAGHVVRTLNYHSMDSAGVEGKAY